MIPLDYGRSFILGRAPANEVRFWVESRTLVTDSRTGASEEYLQAGSCKSENTFAESDLFIEDNYDFLPVFGPEWGLIYRRKAAFNGEYRSIVATDQMWEGQAYHLCQGDHVAELSTAEAVREATYRFVPIVAQTTIADAATGLEATIEFPVKTMNTHRERNLYQVDSGPVVLPDLGARRPRHVDGMRLAFVAFNGPHAADFVVEVETPLREEGGPRIHHYSERLSLPACNRLFAVGGEGSREL